MKYFLQKQNKYYTHIYIFKDHVVLFLTAPAMTMNGALGGSNIGTHQQYLELSVMVHWRVKYWKERTRNIQYRMKKFLNIHIFSIHTFISYHILCIFSKHVRGGLCSVGAIRHKGCKNQKKVYSKMWCKIFMTFLKLFKTLQSY